MAPSEKKDEREKDEREKEKFRVTNLVRNSDGTYDMTTGNNGTSMISRLYVLPEKITRVPPNFTRSIFDERNEEE